MKITAFRTLVVAAASVCLALPLAAQSSTVANRIVAPIDETNLITLKGNVHPLAQARNDRGPAPVATPTGRVMLVLQRSASQQQALTQYLADVQNASSPNYHKWLTPAQYGAQFGISDSDLQTVQSWLQSHGFKIEKIPQARNVILFSGNFEQLQTAFHTSIHSLQVNGESHFANMTDPQIPAALAAVVAGVGPLNDFHPKAPIKMGPRGHFDAATKRIVPNFTGNINGADYLFVVPADAATIYDTPDTLNTNYKSGTTYDGTGVNIGIGGTSDIATDDVQNYRTAFLGETLGSVNLPTTIVDGDDPGMVSGWDVEGLLDVEVSGGLAPKAKVYFYTSADTDLSSGFVDAVFRAVGDNYVSILSMSIGECEAELGNSGNVEVLEGTEQAAAQGITVVVAASDNGSAGCDDFDTATAAQYGLQVNGFASTPYDVAVGGTDYDTLENAFSTYASNSQGTLPYYGSALKYIPENPWNDSTTVNTTYLDNVAAKDSQGNTNIVAGSGGFSSCVTQNSTSCTGGYLAPAFQTSVVPSGLTNSNEVRMVPDISFLAGNGFYGALWALCSDPQSDGVNENYTDCLNNNGVFDQGTQIAGVGGTSAAAPAFAGMLALVAQANGSPSDNYRLGQIDPILYQLATNATTHAAVFHDVTAGNNSVVCASGSPNCGTNSFLNGYNAGAGYDLATGYGSVDVKNLIADWTNVKLGATSTAFNIGGSTAAYTGTHGAILTFNTSVNPTSATGFVAIVDNADETAGGTTSGIQNNGQISIPVKSGSGLLKYNGLPGGKYTVMARYGGDVSNAASTSAGISVDISAEPSTTTLQVNTYDPQTGNKISNTNTPYGSLVYLDAQITGTAEGINPVNTQGVATGTVNFFNGAGRFATNTVGSNNLASYAPFSNGYIAFIPGSYSVTADYSGDASFGASNSSPAITFSVVQASTVTAATASPTSIASNGNAVVNVTVTSPYNAGNPPSGGVGISLGSTPLTGINSSAYSVTPQEIGGAAYWVLTGSASVLASQLQTGTNTLTAAYGDDTNYAASSASFTVTVSNTTTTPTIALTNSGNISVTAGATTGNTSTITVTPGGGFTGSVTLTCAVTTSISSPNDPPTCSVASPVTISGTTAATGTLTVSTTATTTSALASPLNKFFLGGGATLALAFFFGVPGRRRAWRTALSVTAICVVALIAIAGTTGCGGSNGGGGGGGKTIPGTTAGTYTVTVTGADTSTGKVTGNTAVTLTVN